MKYDAVIFDLFGTLVDFLTAEQYRQAHLAIASALSAPADAFRQAWVGTVGDRDRGCFGSLEGDIEHVCRSMGLQPEPADIATATSIRLNLYRRNLDPRAGAVKTLRALKVLGCRLGLISDCAAEVPRLWAETPFASLIDAPVFSCEARTTKPDPRIYYMACERLGVDPQRCLYVGDGGSRELTGAARVGMHPVLIRNHYDEGFEVTLREDALEWSGPVIFALDEILALAR